MKHKQRIIQAGDFKAHCLRLMDEVKKTGQELTITKRNIPIVRMCPIEKSEGLFGIMKGTARIKGDIIQPIDEAWDANH